VAQIAALLAGIAAPFFVIPPPISIETPPDGDIVKFTAFILAILVGLLLVACAKLARKKYATLWIWLTSIAALATVFAFFLYMTLLSRWTCVYGAGLRLMVGPSPDGRDCSIILTEAAGMTVRIWDRQLLSNHQMMLQAVFGLGILVTSVTVICLVQSRRCSEPVT
jgi:energy-coupling factor transporter transmembrane protein EcfT